MSSSARRCAVLAGALLLAGCGGQGAPDMKALQQEATTLQSTAAEGSLLASDAARGRSTSTFVRVHANELAVAARSSAAVFAKGRGTEAHQLAGLADRVGRDLDRVSHSPSDRAIQRRLASVLARAAARASRLARRL